MRKNKPAGQSILEYAVLFAVLLLAIAYMGRHVRNVLSGKMRDGADTFGQGEVYRPFVQSVYPNEPAVYYRNENRKP